VTVMWNVGGARVAGRREKGVEVRGEKRVAVAGGGPVSRPKWKKGGVVGVTGVSIGDVWSCSWKGGVARGVMGSGLRVGGDGRIDGMCACNCPGTPLTDNPESGFVSEKRVVATSERIRPLRTARFKSKGS